MTKRKIRLSPAPGTVSRREVESVVKAVHVAPEDGEWVVLKVGPKRLRKSFESRNEAVSYARGILEDPSSGVILHGVNGNVVRATGRRLSKLASLHP